MASFSGLLILCLALIAVTSGVSPRRQNGRRQSRERQSGQLQSGLLQSGLLQNGQTRSVRYYHYTSLAGKNGIVQSGRIESNVPRLRGNPAGVYLTTIPPSAGKEAIARNNYNDNAFRGMMNQGRVDYAIWIDFPSDQQPERHWNRDNRNIFLLTGQDLILSRYNWSWVQVPGATNRNRFNNRNNNQGNLNYNSYHNQGNPNYNQRNNPGNPNYNPYNNQGGPSYNPYNNPNNNDRTNRYNNHRTNRYNNDRTNQNNNQRTGSSLSPRRSLSPSRRTSRPSRRG